jgi:AAA domain
VWVIGGAPGSGKTTVADLLLQHLIPTPALLDKDTMYNPFDEAILTLAHRPVGEREGSWYDEHIKQYAYVGLCATTREIRSKGCPVLLSGPFTSYIHDVNAWNALITLLGGGTVHLYWIQTDAESLHHRLQSRGLPRDAEKLAHFEDFVSYMQLNTPPPVPHTVIDNRLSSNETLEAQIAKLNLEHSK